MTFIELCGELSRLKVTLHGYIVVDGVERASLTIPGDIIPKRLRPHIRKHKSSFNAVSKLVGKANVDLSTAIFMSKPPKEWE